MHADFANRVHSGHFDMLGRSMQRQLGTKSGVETSNICG